MGRMRKKIAVALVVIALAMWATPVFDPTCEYEYYLGPCPDRSSMDALANLVVVPISADSIFVVDLSEQGR